MILLLFNIININIKAFSESKYEYVISDWLVIVFNITAWYLLIFYYYSRVHGKSLILIVLSVRIYKQKLNKQSMALGFSFINLFIFGCVGSSVLHADFL